MLKNLQIVGFMSLFLASCTFKNPEIKGLVVFQKQGSGMRYFNANKDLLDFSKVDCQYSHGETTSCETHLSPSFNWPKDSLQITDKITRSGDIAFKFENGPGDCGQHSKRLNQWNDCARDRERSEISMKSLKVGDKEMWFKFSMFIPEYTKFDIPVSYSLWQLHSKSGPVNFMFRIDPKSNLVWADHVNNDWGYGTRHYKILDANEVKQRWNDFVVHIEFKKFPNKGFVRVFANNEIKVNYKGLTENQLSRQNYMKFGIYKSNISRWFRKYGDAPRSIDVVYFDAVAIGNTCRELELENEGNNCANLEKDGYF